MPSRKAEIIPADSRYIPLTQQKWCCVPTCIQMVMVRHQLPLVPAELIGYHLGLVVPKAAADFFWNPRTGKRPPAGYGTQAGKAAYSPNAMFKKLGIPLTMTWSLINRFKTIDAFRQYLADSEHTQTDMLVCFDWPMLFDENRTDHWGHVCILDRVFSQRDVVRIVDPDPDAAKWREVSIEKLYQAMVFHGQAKSAGFWELSLVG